MPSDSIQILTPKGFKPFGGIRRYWHETSRLIRFSDGSTVNVADLHRFITDDGGEILGKDVSVGFVLRQKTVVSNHQGTSGWFYDPINVADGAVYVHDDGLVSHNSFHGTGNTLINAETLLALKAENPVYTQNGVRVYEKPIEDHNYVMTVDVAKGRNQDYSTFSIIDVSVRPFKQVATFRDAQISPLLFPDVIYKYAKTYNKAFVLVESNDQGSVVCNGLYYELEYENMFVESIVQNGGIGITTTKKTKRIGCSNLKDLIEQKKLHVVDADTIQELSTFEAVGASYEAAEGNHDDTTMNLVLFAWFAATDMFLQMSNIDLRNMLYSERLVTIEENLAPVGILGNLEPEKNENREVDADGNVWEVMGTTPTY